MTTHPDSSSHHTLYIWERITQQEPQFVYCPGSRFGPKCLSFLHYSGRWYTGNAGVHLRLHKLRQWKYVRPAFFWQWSAKKRSNFSPITRFRFPSPEQQCYCECFYFRPKYAVLSSVSVRYLVHVSDGYFGPDKGIQGPSIRGFNLSFSGCCEFRSEESTADVIKKSNLNVQKTTGTKGSTNCDEAKMQRPPFTGTLLQDVTDPGIIKERFHVPKAMHPDNCNSTEG